MRILIFYKIFLILIGGVSSQCPSSTQPLLSNNQVLSCQPQEKCACERMRLGSFCQYSAQHARYICCASYSNQCINGAPLLSNTGNVVTCFSNQNCQSGYTCTQQTCCASTMPALCSNSETYCLDGQALINGVCVNQVGLGGLCQDNAQCLGQSQCISGRCQCPTGSIASGGSCVNQPTCQLGTVSINGQCLSFSAPGNQCVASAQCIDSSQCMNSFCTCPSSMRNVNGYCIPYTGGPCLQTQTLVNSQCVTYSIIGGSCIADTQCVGGTYCQNSVCQCKQGTTAMYGYCISDYTVSCNSNQVYLNGQCHQQVQPGGVCYLLKQCVGNSVCLNGLCQCGSGGSPSAGYCPSNPCGEESVLINYQCYSIVGPGSQCTWMQQCSGNTRCTNGYCSCPTGSTLSNGQCTSVGTCGNNQVFVNNQCYPIAQVGSSCVYTQQCTGNSQCSNGYCQCPSGSSLNNGQCSPSGTCGNNQVFINNQCYPMAQIGSSCVYSEQCTGNSQCSSGSCRCPTGSTLNNGQCFNSGNCGTNQVSINNQCYPIAQVGSSCVYTQQCSGNSQCSNGYCQCPSGSSLNNGQCSTSGTCGNNQVFINNQCYPMAQVGSSCVYSEQCTGNSQCSSGSCRCPTGSTLNNGQCFNSGNCGTNQVSINNQCYPIAQVGSSCVYTQQCSGNSQCSNGSCRCPTGSTLSNGQCSTNTCKAYQLLSGGLCYDKVSIGQSCKIAAQCEVQGDAVCSSTCRCSSGSFNGTHCLSSVSSCSSGTVFVNSRCLSQVQLNQYCQFTPQCLGFGVCVNTFCVCPSNFININGTCRSTTTASSCPGNQTLDNGVCRCPSNMIDYGDGVCRNPSSDQSNICEAGEEPAYSNGQLNNCLYQACPTASYCKLNSRLQQYVCCKKTVSQIPTTTTCSNPSQTVVYENNKPLNCIYSNCPANAHCEYNNALSQYICCKSA